jgi:hypothetical protein
MQISRKWGLSALLALTLVVPARAADLDKYVPADAEQVFVVNVKQLLDSALVKKHGIPQIKKMLESDEHVKKLMEFTGLDPLKDISSVTITNAGQTGDKVSFIARGKFNTEKIHAVATKVAEDKKDELKISKLGDRHLYEGTKDGKSAFITFIDGTTVVGSTSKDVLTALVDGKGGKNKALAAALENIDGKQSVYMAGIIPAEVRDLLGNLNQGPADALKKLKTVAGGVTITGGVAAGLRLSTGDDKAAKELAEFGDMLKGLLAFAAASNKQAAPVVNDLLKTLAIKSTQGDVTIDFKVGADVIEKALKPAPKKDD